MGLRSGLDPAEPGRARPGAGSQDSAHAKWRTRQAISVNEGHLVCDSPEWRAAVRDKIIPWAVGDVDLGDDVLEIGPGYGATTDVFAELLPQLTSVEIDPDLAARLRTRYVGTHVDVLLGDATQLTFPDGRFSGAVCFSMLHHIPSPGLQDRLFAEAARVLRRARRSSPSTESSPRAYAPSTKATPTSRSTLRHCRPGSRMRVSPMSGCD